MTPFLDRLRERFEVIYDPDTYADRPRLLQAMYEAEAILIRNRTRIDRELLSAAPMMRVVGRLGVGLDNIDLEACSKAGVTVIPALGANAVSVAEYVFGAMLVLTRGVYGMADRVELDTLLTEADLVSVHTALTDETNNLIDGPAIARMKRGAILINTSRGGTVDELALAEALRVGALGGAALDVFATEPLNPERAAMFTGIDNLILTPHVAGNTAESVDRVAKTIVDSVLDALGD